MRVLLVSPCPSIDPPGGDVTYTLALLETPPAGIVYEPYDEALKRGALREHGRRASFADALRRRRGVVSEALLVGASHLMNRARQGNLLFWEPFRFFSLESREFDLVHMHIFSARFAHLHCPLVVSNGGELAHLYRHARGFSEPMIRRREHADRLLGRLFGVNVNSEYLPDAARLQTYSDAAARSFADRKVFFKDKIDVVPTFLPSVPAIERSPAPRRVGFIARDFAHKGGPTLLEAWRSVREHNPDAELLIVGCEAELSEEEARRRGIVWRSYIPREELLGTTLPLLDVFAYPTNYDYLPYALLEVMSRGIPVAASDHGAMPEVLDSGSAGLLSAQGDAGALARNIIRLLDPEENKRFGLAAREQFERRFSAQVVLPMIRASYDEALAN